MAHRLLSTPLFLLVGAFALAADELPWDTSPSTAWPAGPGPARIELRADYLKDFGVEVRQAGGPLVERTIVDVEVVEGRLWSYVPYGNFEAFNGGQLTIRSDLALSRAGRTVDLSELVLIPAEKDDSARLLMIDAQGRHLASITHIHALADPQRNKLTLHNADLQGSLWLAEALGLPELAGMPIGQMWLDLTLDVPDGANLSRRSPDRSVSGLSCSGRPFWPQDDPSHRVDVALIQMNTVAYQGRETATGRVKVAPSATLKNVNFGDAAWIPKFSSIGSYPHEPRDQHPFLVWNMYRISDGRIEQLAASGVKHAFLTLNFNCDINCGSGNILWPGCEDVYSSGTNDSNSNQGPREDIIASRGLFWSTGSFFDPGGIGSQTNNSGTYENRLMVAESELGNAEADYFFDAWYVIQHDINIWNSMGYHSISPSPVGNGWNFGPLGPFTSGTPLTEWVAENQSGLQAGHALVRVKAADSEAVYPNNLPQGHLRVLVQVTDLGDGQWRYNYAVMNFDFDRGVRDFVIPINPGAEVQETWMSGPPDVLEQAWTAEVLDRAIRFSAPDGGILPWFTLYNFEIVIDQAPQAGGVGLLPSPLGDLRGAGDAVPLVLSADLPSPGLVQAGDFAIGGTLSGLEGDQVVIDLNGAEPLALTANGSFEFVTRLPDLAAFEVRVTSQPSAPEQICTVEPHDDLVQGGDVDLALVCSSVPPVIFDDRFESAEAD